MFYITNRKATIISLIFFLFCGIARLQFRNLNGQATKRDNEYLMKNEKVDLLNQSQCSG